MIDKYCRKSGPLGYKEELTCYHVWICKFLTCSVSKRNVKYIFLCTSKCLADDVKVVLAIFFWVSCTTKKHFRINFYLKFLYFIMLLFK